MLWLSQLASRTTVSFTSLEDTPVRGAPVLQRPELPGGGRQLLPARRLVALYGSPGEPGLGSLGHQPLAESLERSKLLAAAHQPFSAEPVLPALDIIATVAHAAATPDGDYSREVEVSKLEPWVTAAKKAGVYVVLDLQPGRSDFLAQAKLYEQLLKEPHVGLALDPEWRLKPGQLHLKQTGAVDASEVNAVGDWLSDLTRQHRLPQKMFLLHQFKLKMLPDRDLIKTNHPELAYVIQMDGQGSQGAKLETYRAILQNPPPNVYFGWKNFYQKDAALLSPEATMKLSPAPWFVSYQ